MDFHRIIWQIIQVIHLENQISGSPRCKDFPNYEVEETEQGNQTLELLKWVGPGHSLRIAVGPCDHVGCFMVHAAD